MAKVFISYRHTKPDEDLAVELANYLASCNISFFLDRAIRFGDKWSEVIERELRRCSAFVVLLSKDSIRSDLVRQEVKLAHKRGKAVRMFPVRVDYEGALPYDLGAYLDTIQHQLWRPGDSFEAICKAILETIRLDWPITVGGTSPEALRQLREATESGAPMPYADPRSESGGLKLDSPFYVRRNADSVVESLVIRSGETILLKGPSQVGKTSLAVRAKAAAENHRQQVCYIDFELVDDSHFTGTNALLLYIANRLSREFHTTVQPKDVWDEPLGATDSLTHFIEHAVLEKIERPAVLCLDKVDKLFTQSYHRSFFGMLRAWHNRRATHQTWNNFNQMIVHSAEPSFFLDDLHQSPFNVGSQIVLGDFSRDEIDWLNARTISVFTHRPTITREEDLDKLEQLVGGHPFLTRQALYTLATEELSIDALERLALDNRGPFADHLRRQHWLLSKRKKLRKAFRQIINKNKCDDESAFQYLCAAGLTVGQTRHEARARCDLYRSYMAKHL
jgi:hypothetical protein